MRLDTDSADLRARLAQVEAERDATQTENAELRRRLAEMTERASQPQGTYRPPEYGEGRALCGHYEPPFVCASGAELSPATHARNILGMPSE